MADMDYEDISGDGGVLMHVRQRGPGTEHPRVGDQVEIHYTGYLKDSHTQFDSSRERGSALRFTLGQAQVIKVCDIIKTSELS